MPVSSSNQPDTIENRLIRRSFESESGCYIWEGSRDSGGYGTIFMEGKIVKVHRASWVVHKGSIPEDVNVLHSCDTPACWNPDHLFLGTQQDNIADMYNKGRQPNISGANNPNTKLTEFDIIEILALLNENKLTQKEIADQFYVAQTTISNINRNGWAKLKDKINAGI